MNKIVTLTPPAYCEKIKDRLMPFFQSLDDEMSSEDMVAAFLKYMDESGLAMIGKIVTITLSETSHVSDKDLNDLQTAWSRDYSEPIVLVVPPDMHFTVLPGCENA